ncbi:BgTH12-00466 [Blumeria graminis f. sp. triticale]|uniref:BgtA-21393 n=3 Tax=Blumeria graminis TaxID=34373 RepID=A0A9X9MM57_BLUGR|nr:hypothetical protein BGT96224_A21393 [Blumeria graminis f. sp. tritici 96224]CAD6504967.1 BgTH12-00466 [Blumeria graminis f. sp. triticale]VDB92986.1 BgtA-21393 [Blumeria graminis f. sp. tritici]
METYTTEEGDWMTRERIARVIIKNSLGPTDYQQILFAKIVEMIWKVLISLHRSTGAQAKVDMIWNFWSKRCSESASVREHIGDIRSLHMELAETGIIFGDYLLARSMSKSLPPYDGFVSSIFAGIRDLKKADPNYMANKIFEEEMCRNSKYE